MDKYGYHGVNITSLVIAVRVNLLLYSNSHVNNVLYVTNHNIICGGMEQVIFVVCQDSAKRKASQVHPAHAYGTNELNN